jgi:hypothetical protein
VYTWNNAPLGDLSIQVDSRSSQLGWRPDLRLGIARHKLCGAGFLPIIAAGMAAPQMPNRFVCDAFGGRGHGRPSQCLVEDNEL